MKNYDDVGEVESIFAMHADQFAINANRSGTGRQPQNGVLSQRVPLANHTRNHLGHTFGQVFGRVKDISWQPRSRHRSGGRTRRRIVKHDKAGSNETTEPPRISRVLYQRKGVTQASQSNQFLNLESPPVGYASARRDSLRLLCF